MDQKINLDQLVADEDIYCTKTTATVYTGHRRINKWSKYNSFARKYLSSCAYPTDK